MNVAARETIAAEIDSDKLHALQIIAEREGRSVAALIEEALSDLLEKRNYSGVRTHVMAAYEASHAVYAPLYKKLSE